MDNATRQQATLAASTSVSGFGFWSGRDVTLTFQPAAADTGVTFVRTDLPGQPVIPAVVRHRIQGPRRTTLVHNGCAVEMVEHVLAALAGLKIDNCEVHVNRAEMPGCDGSSQPFVNALISAGRLEQDATRPQLIVQSTVRVGDDQSWIEASPVDQPTYRLTYELNYPQAPVIGAQSYTAELPATAGPDTGCFVDQIAPARTFVLESEALALQQQGLGLRVTNQDVLVFDEHGTQENSLRYANECARHKVLDMIGDFSLSGFDLVGDFAASRSGHKLNSQMVFALLSQASQFGQPAAQRKSA